MYISTHSLRLYYFLMCDQLLDTRSILPGILPSHSTYWSGGQRKP